MNTIYKMLCVLILSSATAFLTISGHVSAAYTTYEENYCFELLSETVKSQYGTDLSSVRMKEEINKRVDLSNYKGFQKKLVRKGKDSVFLAKRNNIGTIRAKDDYVQSQFTAFGNKTDFTFPLKSENDEYVTGDIYPDFRENIIYTHHLLDGTFVSCGYLKVEPLGTNDLYSIGQESYKTNVFEGSGFEILDDSVIKSDAGDTEYEYLIGKVVVEAENYGDNPLFKIQLVTVAFNNESNYFNEFITFPKQVEAMTNTDNQEDGMFAVMENFFQKVIQETCLDLVHTNFSANDGSLGYPDFCKDKPGATGWSRDSFLDRFIANIFPYAQAKIAPVENYTKKMEKARGIVIYDGLPYELYQKLEKLENEDFKNAMKLALIPNYEKILEHKKQSGEELSPYESVFLGCDIDYTERVQNITAFLEKLDPNTPLDYENLDYINEEFGNCVIPYQDKDQLGTTPEGSFFEEVEKIPGKELEIPKVLQAFYQQETELFDTFNERQQMFQKRLEEGENIGDEELGAFKKENEIFFKKSADLRSEIEGLEGLSYEELIEKSNGMEKKSQEVDLDIAQVNQNLKAVKEKRTHQDMKIYYILAGLLVFIGVGMLGFGIGKSPKK